jgi:hypothetical protein
MGASGEIVVYGTGSYLRLRKHMARLTLTEALFSNEVIGPAHSHERAYLEIILKGGFTEHYLCTF